MDAQRYKKYTEATSDDKQKAVLRDESFKWPQSCICSDSRTDGEATIDNTSLPSAGSSVWVGYLFRLRSTGQTFGSSLAWIHRRTGSDDSARIARSAELLPEPKISFFAPREYVKCM